MSKHVIIFSHGFGVRKDDRGLFTDIAAGLPEAEAIMFDYSLPDEAANTLTVTPLTEQAKKLQHMVIEARAKYPSATIDIIAHSAGCTTASLAHPPGVRKVILTAPPPHVSVTSKLKRWKENLGISFDTTQTTRIPRRDGSTTLVPPSYWPSLKGIDAQALHNAYAKTTDLTIITATEDEILGEVRFDHLSPDIKVIEIATGHNFEGAARAQLIAAIADSLGIAHV
jgi:hypothetical protein